MTVAIALSLKLTLPFPPGVNNLYFNIGRKRAISDRYNKWRKEAAATLWTAKVIRFSGPVNIVVTVRDKGSYDPDGKLKAVLDFLVTHRIIVDDDRAIVRSVTARVGDVEACEVEITSA